MKIKLSKPEAARSGGAGPRWPVHLFNGRVRTSTVVLIIAFAAVWWVYDTYRAEPTPPAAPQVVPPGFIPDPAYTWVPRTRLQQPPVTITATPTPTETTEPTAPPTSEPGPPTPVPGFPFCPPLCPPPPPAPPEHPEQGPPSPQPPASPGASHPPAPPGAPTPPAPPGPVTVHPAVP